MKDKCCKSCNFFSDKDGYETIGWCDKRKFVVGRPFNFFSNILRDFCNFFFKSK